MNKRDLVGDGDSFVIKHVVGPLEGFGRLWLVAGVGGFGSGTTGAHQLHEFLLHIRRSGIEDYRRSNQPK